MRNAIAAGAFSAVASAAATFASAETAGDPVLSGPALTPVTLADLHGVTLTTALSGGLPLLMVAGLGALLIARRTWRAETAPVTQVPMGAPVSRKQITELRGPQAALEVVGEGGETHRLSGSMIRIGRHEDNDIQLVSQTVHRYHAVLHVTPRQQFVLTDLSGPEGNGVLVNDSRVEQVELAPGDVIELGETKLRFSLNAVN